MSNLYCISGAMRKIVYHLVNVLHTHKAIADLSDLFATKGRHIA